MAGAALGVARRGQIRLRALSHSAGFERRSRLVSAIENAMEEALDQHASVLFPPPPEGARIAVAHGDLAAVGNTAHVASVVIQARGTPMRAASFTMNWLNEVSLYCE